MTDRIVVNQPLNECKTTRSARDSVHTLTVTIRPDVSAFNAAMARAAEAFANFARALSPHWARLQQIRREERCRQIRIAYRARARRRTRSRR